MARDDVGRRARRSRHHAAAVHRTADGSPASDARPEPFSRDDRAADRARGRRPRRALCGARADRADAWPLIARPAAHDADDGGGRVARARSDRAAAIRAAARADARADARRTHHRRGGFPGGGPRERVAAVGLRAPAATRRRRHEPRPAPLFAAPGQRWTSRRGVRARAAPCGGDLGRRRDHPPSRDASARAASVALAAHGRGRLVRGRARRDRGRPSRRPSGPRRSPVVGDPGRRRVRARPRACERPDAPRLADRAARRIFPRAPDAGGRDVPIPARTRHRSQGAADRDDVRSTGGEPARGSPEAAAASGRADRRDSVARRAGSPRRVDAGAGSHAGVRGLVAHRPGHLSSDVRGRVVQRGRPPGERLQAQPARIRDDGVSRGGMRSVGTAVRRGVAIRIYRAARAAHRPRRLRARPHGRQHRRARDARLPDAALHLVAEPVPRIAAAQPPGRAGRRVRARRRVHRLRMESGADLRVGHARVDASRSRLPAARQIARAVLGHARSRRPDVPRVLPERSRRHLRARLSGHQLGGPSDQPGGTGDAGGGAVRHAARRVDAVQRPRRADGRGRPRAASRGAIQLLPQAVPGVLGGRGRTGVHPRDLHPDVRRDAAPRRRDGGCRARRHHGAASRRRLRGAAAARRHGARRNRRSDHGARPPGDRRGREPVRPDAPAGDKRPGSLRVATPVAPHPGRCLPIDSSRSSADIRGPGTGRRSPLSAGGRARARQRARRDRHRADDEPAAADRTADRRARSPRAVRLRAVQPPGRRARLLDGRAHRRSGESPYTRHPPHRARRSRRARRRHLVGRITPAGRGLQPDGGGPEAPAQRARAYAASRSVGRHGAPGRARHQEPADADSALRRARAAREHRSRPSPVTGARRVRHRHPVAGQAAASDLRGVLQLRLVAHAAAGADGAACVDCRGGRAVSERARESDRH